MGEKRARFTGVAVKSCIRMISTPIDVQIDPSQGFWGSFNFTICSVLPRSFTDHLHAFRAIQRWLPFSVMTGSPVSHWVHRRGQRCAPACRHALTLLAELSVLALNFHNLPPIRGRCNTLVSYAPSSPRMAAYDSYRNVSDLPAFASLALGSAPQGA